MDTGNNLEESLATHAGLGAFVGLFVLSQAQKVTNPFRYYYYGWYYATPSDTLVTSDHTRCGKRLQTSSYPHKPPRCHERILPPRTGEDTAQGIRVPVPGPCGHRYEPRIPGFHLGSGATGPWCFLSSSDVPVFCLIRVSDCNNQGKNKQALESGPRCVAYNSTIWTASLQFLSQRHSLLATVAGPWGRPQDALACVPPHPPLLAVRV